MDWELYWSSEDGRYRAHVNLPEDRIRFEEYFHVKPGVSCNVGWWKIAEFDLELLDRIKSLEI